MFSWLDSLEAFSGAFYLLQSRLINFCFLHFYFVLNLFYLFQVFPFHCWFFNFSWSTLVSSFQRKSSWILSFSSLACLKMTSLHVHTWLLVLLGTVFWIGFFFLKIFVEKFSPLSFSPVKRFEDFVIHHPKNRCVACFVLVFVPLAISSTFGPCFLKFHNDMLWHRFIYPLCWALFETF